MDTHIGIFMKTCDLEQRLGRSSGDKEAFRHAPRQLRQRLCFRSFRFKFAQHSPTTRPSHRKNCSFAMSRLRYRATSLIRKMHPP